MVWIDLYGAVLRSITYLWYGTPDTIIGGSMGWQYSCTTSTIDHLYLYLHSYTLLVAVLPVAI